MSKCPECSSDLPPDAPEGICPACLMRRGLNPSPGLTAAVSHMEAILFTDIADSTGFKARVGPAAYSRDLRRHNNLFEQCIRDSTGGSVIKHTGDGFFAHFAEADDAVLCALRFQRALAAEAWRDEAIRVRVGVHIGEVEPLRMANRTDLVGTAVDEASRIMSLAAGGQILLSGDAADSARLMIHDTSLRWKRHGLYKLKGVSLPIEIWQVADVAAGLLLDPPGSLDAAIPAEIGPYRILEQLGEGGMGTVYKAEQRRPVKRIVALKVIKPGLGSTEVVARFESERQALARMDHPSIAKVLDAGQTESGQPYFAMEYVPGVPITKFADDKKLSLQQRLELFRDVCSAIAHAHTKAIIHRDIKSSNVLAYLSDDKPFVKVIDFGIAKALTGDRLTDQTFNTDRGRAIGTFDSMSPEQAEGSPDIDTRTDVYSLGVLLYELLTGAPPFDRATLAKAADLEVRRIIQEVEPPRPSARLSSLGDAGTKIAASRREKLGALEHELRSELEWIPLMAMRKDRDRRYASPLEFSADIDNYLHGRPLQAGPEKVSYRLRKFLQRNKGAVAAAAAIVFLLVGGIISTSLGMSWAMKERVITETARQSEVAAKERAIASAQEALDAKTRADQSAFDAKRRLAEGLLSQGDALGEASRWLEAKNAYRAAFDGLVDLKVSPFGALAAMSMADAASPPPLLTLTGHTGFAAGLAISPDGHTAVSGSMDHTIKVWNLSTGTVIRTILGHTNAVTSVAFSPDGRSILSGSFDKTLKLWDLQTGKEIRTFTGHTDVVSSVAFTPDGRSIVSGSADKTLKLWDLATGKEVRTLTGHTDIIVNVAVGPDGRSALSAGNDGTIRLWNLPDGKLTRTFNLRKLEPHARQVFAVAFSPDGRTALSGDISHAVRLWDLATGNEIRTLDGHTNGVDRVVFTPDGHQALSAGGDFTVKLWDVDTGTEIRTFVGCGLGLAVSPDGRFALSGNIDNSVKLISLDPGNEVRTLWGHTDPATCIAISPDGRTALSGSYDKTVKLWDLATGNELQTLPIGNVIGNVAFSPDGRSALVGSIAFTVDFSSTVPGIEGNTLTLWDLTTGQEIHTLTGHTRGIGCVAFSPDGRTALSGSSDHTLKLWDLVTGKEIRTLSGHTNFVNQIAFNADGRTAWSGSLDGTIRLWNLADGKQIRQLNAHSSVPLTTSLQTTVTAAAFSPDRASALCAESNMISFRDLATGKEIRILYGHSGAVVSVAFSPDGQSAASGGYDHIVKIWDLQTGKEIRTLTGHNDVVTGVAFTPDGRSVISCSLDASLKLWKLSSAQTRLDFEPRVRQAQATLQENPDDPAALATLGNWYAFRGVDDWAVDFLEKARAGGAEVSSLTLARCYWNLNKLPEAKQEFQKSLDAGEAPADYLNLCINALAVR